ncbi:MAG: amino acid adenylation domain-containing protein [Eubacteriaceae bacterium]|nr:amino acid adenylation domain-containing protein [Eubacteriaceae bacterium]
MNNVLEYLEETVLRVPEKTAFQNDSTAMTFSQVYSSARCIGSFLINSGYCCEPVAVFMNKSPQMIAAFFGVLYSGCYYVPIDEEMPQHRIKLVLDVLKPRFMICDEVTMQLAEGVSGCEISLYSEVSNFKADESALANVRETTLDIDPIYIVFTSGSTGIPKGIAACHRSVIDYIETLSDALEFGGNTVFGNQSPLCFDACLKELYPTIKFGACTVLIPKHLFSFPVKLIEFLNEYKINTICWVASALSLVSGMGAFDVLKPEYLHTVAFGSEVFPIKQFHRWREALPNATFTNLYGPTEATGMSCYYRVDRDFEDTEPIPIGKPFPNTGIMLIGEDGQLAKAGEAGEIYIRGTAVTLGYFRDPDRTEQAYVQNPLNNLYPETVYKTGDLAYVNERGELVYVSRKDYQIKHMGRRIELGEIEAVCNATDGVEIACCVFDDANSRIILCYSGAVEAPFLQEELKERLPRYMLPHSVYKLGALPFTLNGKIDRNLIKDTYAKGDKL